MKAWFIGLNIIVLATSCIRGVHQTIELKNSSSESVYYLISKNRDIPYPNEIANIRPISYKSSIESEKDQAPVKNKEDSMMRMRIKQNLYRYRIEKNATAILLSSESAEIFVDAVSIQSIIRDRYNREANVFIIKAIDLDRNSDTEIINQKLYTKIISLTEEQITSDSLSFEYK